MIGVGAVLAGKYRLLAMLGRGGMGTVFRAENLLTGKQVALKCLNAPLTAACDATQRLLREARAASSVSHPSVVDIYDIVQDREYVCLVMELLHGETLRGYLQRNLQPKISEFIALVLPAIAGAAAAHACGVIHRDLKPDNIFLARVPERPHPLAKVLDFGISKQISVDNETLTRTGATIGTPLYMSIEQLRGDKNIDARTDVYAMGVILYEAISGRLPHHADTLPELAIKLATVDPPSLKSLRPDIPTSLAKLIDWALSRDRDQRPTMQTLYDELQVFARDYSLREQLTQAAGASPRLAAISVAARSQSTAAALAPTANTSLPEAESNRLRAQKLPEPVTRIRHLRGRWIAAGLLSALIAAGWRALNQPPVAAVPQQARAAHALPQSGTEPTPMRARAAVTTLPSALARNSDATPAPQASAQAPGEGVHSPPSAPAPSAQQSVENDPPSTAAKLGRDEVVLFPPSALAPPAQQAFASEPQLAAAKQRPEEGMSSPPAPASPLPAAQSTANRRPRPAAKVRVAPRQAAEAQPATVPESDVPAQSKAVQWVGF